MAVLIAMDHPVDPGAKTSDRYVVDVRGLRIAATNPCFSPAPSLRQPGRVAKAINAAGSKACCAYIDDHSHFWLFK
jgi:hypothetical protein